jgi:DNA repair protein RadC
MLAPNHPTGTLKPSALDINLTSRLKEACGLMDIRLLDHIIITLMARRWYN